MADQTFHTPSFGDEELYLPSIGLPAQQESVSVPAEYAIPGTSGEFVPVNNVSQINYATPQPQVGYSSESAIYAPSLGNQHIQYSQPTVSYSYEQHGYDGGLPNTAVALDQNYSYPAVQPQSQYYSVAFQSPNIQPHRPVESHSLQNISNLTLSEPIPEQSVVSGASYGIQMTSSVPVTNQMSYISDHMNDNSISRNHGMAARPQAETVKPQDSNAPQKPVSAYALFFRDTQATIKGQNPNAGFGEVSKIVASMWETMDETRKDHYKREAETAKKDYLKKMAVYRTTHKNEQDSNDSVSSPSISSPSYVKNAVTSPSYVSMNVASPTVVNSAATSLPSTVPTARPIAPRIVTIKPAPLQTAPAAVNVNSPPPVTSTVDCDGEKEPVTEPGRGPGGMCVRSGCPNKAIESPDWDAEYCSNECVVTHCRDVFRAWVSARKITGS